MTASFDKTQTRGVEHAAHYGEARAYANYLSVGHSLSEILLDFGQLFPSGAEPYFLSRLVTSPVHLRAFQQLLEGAVESYEAEYGPLPAAPAAHPVTQ